MTPRPPRATPLAMALTDDELERYARHIVLKEIGGAGQARLRAAGVLIVGAGGVGGPAALYLAAAGVGRIGLVDHDAVALSNLQRQVLYDTGDIARPKVDAAADRLTALNPGVAVDVHLDRLTEANAETLVADYDIVLDGTDDYATRFAVNAACHERGKVLVSAAVGRWQGQVATFKSGIDTASPCYRCLVPEIPPDAETCERAGIVGALVGVVGSMAALEAIKEITGAGDSLAGRLLIYDGLAGVARTVGLKADPGCEVCGPL